MTLGEALEGATRALTSQGIEQPHLEAQLLLAHALGVARVELYLQLHKGLATEVEQAFLHLLERRLKGEPSAYILGWREFYGLEFSVDPRVLIPRPETETLVEAALAWLKGNRLDDGPVADVGTGCGAVAIALARAMPRLQVYAIDVSPGALEMADLNSRHHGVEEQVRLLQGDMLGPLPYPVPLIVANLPYVSDAEYPALPREVRDFEPAAALRGGPDGLDPLRRLLAQATGRLSPGGALMAEIGHGQGKRAVSLARKAFPPAEISVLPDLAGMGRVLQVKTSRSG
ncbi:MAG: peptide chain release factor N(5)-glutamine methyltransferase [Chloroflexi bacterium]|nr:peptide chain release factor N(5)-glutamine methyltransferase [Chloroflexota bacterium]